MNFTQNYCDKNKEKEYFQNVALVEKKKTDKYIKLLSDLENNYYRDIDETIKTIKGKLQNIKQKIREEEIGILNDFKNQCKCDEKIWNLCIMYIQKIKEHEKASRRHSLPRGGKYDERIPVEFLDVFKKQLLEYGLHPHRIIIKCDETYNKDIWASKSPYPMIVKGERNINDLNTEPGEIIFAYPLSTCDSLLKVESFCKHIAARIIYSDYILWNSFFRHSASLGVSVEAILSHRKQYYEKISKKDILWALNSFQYSQDACFYHRYFFESTFSIADFETLVKIKNYYWIKQELNTLQKFKKTYGTYPIYNK